MKVRRIVLNSVLALAVVGVGAVAVTSVGSARTTKPVGQAVAVTRGTLVATVTATGNVEAVDKIQVDLAGSGGTVKKIYVRQGARVTQGQRLLRVDDTSEKSDLKTAQASLDSAEAKLTTTTQSRSGAEVRQDNASIAGASQSVRNAQTSLDAARATHRLDSRQQDAIVDEAEDAVGRAKNNRSDAEDALENAQNKLKDDQASGNTAAISADQSQVSSLTSALQSAKSAVDSAESSLSAAKRTRSSTLLRDRQSVSTAEGQLATAQKQLDQQRAAAAVNAQPARQGAVEDAQSAVDSAQVGVDKAQKALDETVLKAPADGTVATINAVVGQSSGSSGGGSASSSGSGSGSASSAGGSGGGAASTSSTSTTGSTSSSGLVVLTDLTHKQVAATVAEVDVTKLKLGLKSQIVFPASGVKASGTVTEIDTEQTVTNDVVEYGIKVRMDSGDSSVKIGQTASLTITAQQKDGVLIVPTSALRTVNGVSSVTRRVNDVDSPVTIQTGLVGTTGTEVVSGLSEGDQVVLPTTGGS